MSSGRHPGRRRGNTSGLLGLLVAVLAIPVVVLVAVPVWAVVMGLAASAAPSPTPSPPTSAVATAAPTPAPTAPPEVEDAAIADAQAALAGLEDVPGESLAQYYRESFGQTWYDQDRNGCDTRNDILGRDLTGTTIKADTNGCKVLAGTLLDPYTGSTVDFVSGTDTSVLVQIDHLVPLAWAWRHGAEFWDDATRTAFANDPANLRATAGEVNQSKSDSGPADWLPPDAGAHCTYAIDFITVLDAWGLGVDDAERSALEDVLASCG